MEELLEPVSTDNGHWRLSETQEVKGSKEFFPLILQGKAGSDALISDFSLLSELRRLNFLVLIQILIIS